MSSSALVEALLKPLAYPHPVDEVRLVETHISYLFFTGQYVYKVKKAVDFGFLDYTTLEKRLTFCHKETALNSRISPDVYLGVVPITESNGAITVDGKGTPIEYAVKMRQLPQERALNQLLVENKVTANDIQRIASKIAAFHLTADTGPEVTKLGDLNAVRQNVEENFSQALPYIGVTITQDEYNDLKAYSNAFMKSKSDVFDRRVREGRIRDGHGDLHSANVFLDDDIHIIDCIEFNDRFRCLDFTEDIAFLAMDLDFYGRRDMSELFVSAYAKAANDPGIFDLLNFFKTYRAYVRGKVDSLRLNQPDLSKNEKAEIRSEAQGYFKLAHSYVMEDIFQNPTLIIVSGLMGTGKSYISQELSRRWNATYISSDITRKQLAGIESSRHKYESYGEGIYTPEFTRKTYDAMFDEARKALEESKVVILDGTFRGGEERQKALEVAKKATANLWIVECIAPDDEIKRRLLRRTEGREATASDGRWELYAQQKADWEPVIEVPEKFHIRLDTSGENTITDLLQIFYERVLSYSDSSISEVHTS